jgi:CHASE2 domain-containing sensor protein
MNATLKLMIFVAIQLIGSLFLPECLAGTQFDKSIVVVEYDAKSENTLGTFPSRAAIASYVEKIKIGRPKGIVLKFFFDGPGIEVDNVALEKSFFGANILLQATLNKEPPTSRQLDDRFFFKGNIGEHKIALKGDEGWLPIKKFANAASKVCFADARQVDLIPTLVEFQSRPVPSLYACILEELPNSGKMEIQTSRAVFGKYWLPIDVFAETKAILKDLDGGPSISVIDLLKGDFDPKVFADKIVLVTYTGSKSPLISVGNSSYKVHNVFLAELRALFGLLQPIK